MPLPASILAAAKSARPVVQQVEPPQEEKSSYIDVLLPPGIEASIASLKKEKASIEARLKQAEGVAREAGLRAIRAAEARGESVQTARCGRVQVTISGRYKPLSGTDELALRRSMPAELVEALVERRVSAKVRESRLNELLEVLGSEVNDYLEVSEETYPVKDFVARRAELRLHLRPEANKALDRLVDSYSYAPQVKVTK